MKVSKILKSNIYITLCILSLLLICCIFTKNENRENDLLGKWSSPYKLYTYVIEENISLPRDTQNIHPYDRYYFSDTNFCNSKSTDTLSNFEDTWDFKPNGKYIHSYNYLLPTPIPIIQDSIDKYGNFEQANIEGTYKIDDDDLELHRNGIVEKYKIILNVTMDTLLLNNRTMVNFTGDCQAARKYVLIKCDPKIIKYQSGLFHSTYKVNSAGR